MEIINRAYDYFKRNRTKISIDKAKLLDKVFTEIITLKISNTHKASRMVLRVLGDHSKLKGIELSIYAEFARRGGKNRRDQALAKSINVHV
jgi:ribosomal protein L17